ncbi:MAG: hypothetical protein JWQ71_4939 [Pedosphaera sp.]|nr:hypothetical protein [Pedosphaera sp.]
MTAPHSAKAERSIDVTLEGGLFIGMTIFYCGVIIIFLYPELNRKLDRERPRLCRADQLRVVAENSSPRAGRAFSATNGRQGQPRCHQCSHAWVELKRGFYKFVFFYKNC